MGKVINIPIAPHLKKIIINLHQDKEPLKAEIDNQLGAVINQVITDRMKSRISPDSYSEVLQVDLCADLGRRSPRIAKLILINHFYSKYFKFLMMNWVQAQYAAGIPAYQAVKNFLEFYNIQEEEYSYETGYRAWLRYKNQEYSRGHEKKYTPVS